MHTRILAYIIIYLALDLLERNQVATCHETWVYTNGHVLLHITHVERHFCGQQQWYLLRSSWPLECNVCTTVVACWLLCL